MSLAIFTRHKVEVNTDPQRRCYNGLHFSSEFRYTPWEVLEYVTVTELPRRLEFWKELNDYAVSQRGESARREFKLEEVAS